MKSTILSIIVVSLFSSSSAFAEELRGVRDCLMDTNKGPGQLKLYASKSGGGFESIDTVKLRLLVKQPDGTLAPGAEEDSFKMSMVSNFHKGAMYNVDIQWPTGNPGALFFDAGSERVSFAYYRSKNFGSINGTGNCRSVH